MKELNESEWRLLKNIGPEVHNLIIQADEIERAGGQARIVDEKKNEKPAPQPAAGLSESQRDEVQAMINVGLVSLAKAASAATGKVLQEYIPDKLKPLIEKIEAVEQAQTAIRASISNLLRGKGANNVQ
jgi:hypothetical protein